MRNSGTVVVRNGPVMRFGAAAGIGLFAVACWWAIAMSIRDRDWYWPVSPAHPSTFWVVVMWVALPLLTWIFTYLTLVLVMMKQTFAPDGGTMRKVFRTYRIPVENVTRIEFRGFSIHTGSAELPAERLVVSTDVGRFPPRLMLQGGLTNVDEAFAVIAGWVRRRPEIVKGTTAEHDLLEWLRTQPAAPGA